MGLTSWLDRLIVRGSPLYYRPPPSAAIDAMNGGELREDIKARSLDAAERIERYAQLVELRGRGT